MYTQAQEAYLAKFATNVQLEAYSHTLHLCGKGQMISVLTVISLKNSPKIRHSLMMKKY